MSLNPNNQSPLEYKPSDDQNFVIEWNGNSYIFPFINIFRSIYTCNKFGIPFPQGFDLEVYKSKRTQKEKDDYLDLFFTKEIFERFKTELITTFERKETQQVRGVMLLKVLDSEYPTAFDVFFLILPANTDDKQRILFFNLENFSFLSCAVINRKTLKSLREKRFYDYSQ